MLKDVRHIRSVFETELAAADKPAEIHKIRVRFLGRKGEVTSLLKRLGTLPPEERPEAGRILNELRNGMEEDLSRKESECEGQKVALRESDRKA